MKLNRDQIIGILITFLGVWVFFMISSYKVTFAADYPGPQALPGLAAIGFIICGIGIFLEASKKTDLKPFLEKKGWIRLGISFVMLIVYVAAMKFVGYIIATPVFLFVCCTYYAQGYKTTLVQRLIFTVAFTAVVYLVYAVVFGYMLPAGELFG